MKLKILVLITGIFLFLSAHAGGPFEENEDGTLPDEFSSPDDETPDELPDGSDDTSPDKIDERWLSSEDSTPAVPGYIPPRVFTGLKKSDENPFEIASKGEISDPVEPLLVQKKYDSALKILQARLTAALKWEEKIKSYQNPPAQQTQIVLAMIDTADVHSRIAEVDILKQDIQAAREAYQKAIQIYESTHSDVVSRRLGVVFIRIELMNKKQGLPVSQTQLLKGHELISRNFALLHASDFNLLIEAGDLAPKDKAGLFYELAFRCAERSFISMTNPELIPLFDKLSHTRDKIFTDIGVELEDYKITSRSDLSKNELLMAGKLVVIASLYDQAQEYRSALKVYDEALRIYQRDKASTNPKVIQGRQEMHARMERLKKIIELEKKSDCSKFLNL